MFFLVYRHQGRRSKMTFQGFFYFSELLVRKPGIESFYGSSELLGQNNLFIRFPAIGSVHAQLFLIMGIAHLPAQFFPQKICHCLLYQNIFAILIDHHSHRFS